MGLNRTEGTKNENVNASRSGSASGRGRRQDWMPLLKHSLYAKYRPGCKGLPDSCTQDAGAEALQGRSPGKSESKCRFTRRYIGEHLIRLACSKEEDT